MEEKKAKKVYSLSEITFNEENKTMAILSCIPIVGLVLMFVEKKDLFVRYHAVEFGFFVLLPVVTFVFAVIPIIGWLADLVIYLGSLVLIVMGMVKTSQGQRFDIPVLSGLALQIMSALD